MKDKILMLARSLGIDKVGFTNTTKFDDLSELLSYRIKNNYSCEFEEKNLSKRIDASCLLPGCKTIITAVFPYAKGYRIPKADNMGNISVSSHGQDYHKIIYERLDMLVKGLLEHFRFNYKICVDTTPALDRAICTKSGLGRIGKNSMLINDEYGSFVFLGSVLTDIDIIADGESGAWDMCKNCRICIDKCPNGAIMDNGILNTKKCVSYLTQTKLYIPTEFRSAMGRQIYGCDECQVNCPKNIKILRQDSEVDYSSLLIDLEELLKMSNKSFGAKYGSLAGSWRGKNIWKRNAMIACANMKLDNFYEIIREELNGKSDMFKMYSAWVLLELNVRKSKDIIFNKIKYENEFISKEYSRLLTIFEERI